MGDDGVKNQKVENNAKGAAVIFMIAVTRFIVYRSETLSNVGSGRW